MDNHIINSNSVVEPQRELSILDQADVVVAGGGIAGFCAAIGSARAGVKTILIENLSFLGGVATASMMQALNSGRFIDGVAVELIDRMHKKGGATNWNTEERTSQMVDGVMNETITFDVECFKETALEMCLEAGVVLYFYMRVCAPIITDGAARGVIVESKGGRQAILAKRVIDCTGDGDLLYSAGVPYIVGRESIDNRMRPFALMFRVGGMDIPKLLKYFGEHPDQWQHQHRVAFQRKMGEDTIITRMSGFFDLVKQAKAAGELYEWIHYLRFEAVLVEKGIALCNTTRIYNVDGNNPADLTKGEIVGRQQIGKLMNFLRKYVPGCEKAYLIDVAPTIGVRETRRFTGEYFLTDDDCYDSKVFDDTIITAIRYMPIREMKDKIDVHPTIPIEGSEEDFLERQPRNSPHLAHQKFYLNYRMLLPKGVDNMLFAGRTMSTTHLIEAFIRSMAWCMRLGQVAGAAAALSVKENVSPKALDFGHLKDALIAQGYVKF